MENGIEVTNPIADASRRQAAIVTGAAILIMTIAAVIAMEVVLGNLVVPGNAAATTYNIKASVILFRVGVFSWLIILICDVLAAWGLYVFLQPVNKTLSLLMAWFRLVYVAILGAALPNFILVLLIVSNEKYLVVFGIDQLQAQVLLYLNAFNDTWSLGLAVFGFHLFLLGYLVLKSGYIPKILGILLIIASFGYLITNFANLLFPNYENYKATIELIFILPMIIGEVGLGLWLLIKGIKGLQWDNFAST